MFNLNEFLTNEYKNEYGNEYYLPMKKKYSEPKIYIANGDLSKRWYVYYRYRNPKTDQLQKMPSIYLGANNYKTKAERLSVLTSFQRNLSKLLKNGYNPFESNQDLYDNETLTASKKTEKVKVETPKTAPELTIKEAFELALNLKKNILSHTSFRGLNNRMNNFLNWVETNHPQLKSINGVNKKIIIGFLNFELEETSPRNRNNFRADLSSLFQMLVDNEIIPINFIKEISILKSTPTRNKTYSLELQEEIYTHLEEKDPLLLLYIKFISYNFLRPIEVCRLKVKDINIKEQKLQLIVKNNPLKTKIIPEILINELPDLVSLNPEYKLFTPKQIGGEWGTNVSDRRNYFSKRFKKVVKDHFNLGIEYGLYSFRHTFITKLYREFVKDSTPFEAKSKLMPITGHKTMAALEKYLRDIDAELPDDYSHLLK